MVKDKHKHHKCDHNIEYCRPCDEAYCLKCETTFRSEPCMKNHYDFLYSTGTWTYPNSTTITTYDGTIDDGGSMTISNDVHADHVTLT